MRTTLRHRLINLAQSALLLGGMGLLAHAVTRALAGPAAALWVLAGLLAMLLLAPAAPKEVLLRLYGARALSPREFPLGAELLRALAARAGLPRVPALHYVPSRVPNAFAVGTPGDSAIAVSDGLLRLLDRREFAAVLAHETSHIAHGDLWIMALADTLARATAVMVLAGQLILLVNLPLLLMGLVTLPWVVPVLLLLAPVLMNVLHLGLSRAREYDADLGAVRMTGDPAGLASALLKLERRAARGWEGILLPGRRLPEPSLLRTHPPTEARIARLRALAAEGGRAPHPMPARPLRLPGALAPVERPPRLHWSGLWH